MKFIETVRLIRCLEEGEMEALYGNYDRKTFFYDSRHECWLLTRFIDSGLRVEIRPIPNYFGEKKVGKEHPLSEMTICVTPVKLINPIVNLGGLLSEDEIKSACGILGELVQKIEEEWF